MIRLIKRADVPRLVELEKELYQTPWTKEGFDIAFGKYASFYVLEDDGQIIGYIGYLNTGEEIDIAKVSIAKSHQGKGFSKKLMQHLIVVAKNIKAKYITLEVRVSNTPARKLYESFNFKQMGVRKNYYENEDGLVYRLDL